MCSCQSFSFSLFPFSFRLPPHHHHSLPFSPPTDRLSLRSIPAPSLVCFFLSSLPFSAAASILHVVSEREFVVGCAIRLRLQRQRMHQLFRTRERLGIRLFKVQAARRRLALFILRDAVWWDLCRTCEEGGKHPHRRLDHLVVHRYAVHSTPHHTTDEPHAWHSKVHPEHHPACRPEAFEDIAGRHSFIPSPPRWQRYCGRSLLFVLPLLLACHTHLDVLTCVHTCTSTPLC